MTSSEEPERTEQQGPQDGSSEAGDGTSPAEAGEQATPPSGAEGAASADASAAADPPERPEAPPAPAEPAGAPLLPPTPPAPSAGAAPAAAPGSDRAWVGEAPAAGPAPGGAQAVGAPAAPASPLAAREPWVAGAISAGLGLAGALTASLVVTLTTVFAVQASGDADIAGIVNGAWFGLLVQFVGMGFLGPLGLTTSVFGAAPLSAAVFVVPVLVPVAAVAAILLFARRLAPPVDLAIGPRLAVAGAAGAAFSVVVALLQTVAPVAVRIPMVPPFDLRAVSVWSVLLSLVVIGVAVLVVLSPRGATRGRWRSAAAQAGEHLGAVGVVLGLVVFVVMAVQAGDGTASLLLLAPLLLPLLALDGAAIGGFSSVLMTGQGQLAGYGGDDSLVEGLSVFGSGLEVWQRILVIILALAALAVASIRWRVRRGAADDAISWALLPVAYGAAGLVVTAVGRVSASLAGSVEGVPFLGGLSGYASLGVGPAAWTFVLFAVIGVVVDVLARFVVPAVVRLMPRGLLRVLAAGTAIAPSVPRAAAAPSHPAPASGTAPGPGASTEDSPVAPAAGFDASPAGAPPVGAPAQSPLAPGAAPEAAPPTPAAPARPPAPGEAVAPLPPTPSAPADAGEPAGATSPDLAETAVLPPAAAPASAGDPLAALLGDEASQPAKPVSRRAKVGWIVTGGAVALVAVLAIAGSLVRGHLAETRFSPQAQVEDYLESVVAGDASGALALWGPNVTTGERVLLDDAVYAAAENRPTAHRILRTDAGEGSATVSAALTVDGKQHELWFELEADGTQAMIFDAWRITSGPEQSLRVAVGDGAAGPASVNGVEVDLSGLEATEGDGPGGTAALPVLPGTYSFAAPADTGVFTYGDDVAVEVLPDADRTGEGAQEEPVAFAPRWGEEAQQQAIAAVQERIDLCMTSDQFQPSDCRSVLGMYEPSYAVTGIERSWDEKPELSFEEGGDDGWGVEEPPAVVVSGGVLRIDYEWRWDEDDEWESDTTTDSAPFGGWGGSARVPVHADEDGEVTVDLSEF
ncbi:hypothetical protein [Microbacterium sp. gxy059]|uniref:hypothetical protein n=1 Tax=Microbacterium sp. gxy059 TaxID=2957199 RepID=UPI003D99258D